ncbi:MAG: hypothetical protein ACK5PP_04025 [Acidimicrobiales bacterium]
MFTWGSKFLFGLSAGSLVGAWLYGLFSGGSLVGVISIGYKGGVGDLTGYAILLTIAAVMFLLGLLNLMIRDGSAEVAAESVGADHALTVSTPRASSYWGPLAAFGLAAVVLGIAVSTAFLILGAVVLFAVAIEWLILDWSDRATGDPDVNAAIRSRLAGPFEVPVLALLGAAFLVLALSRVLLALSSPTASTIFAGVAAAIVFALAIAIAKSNAPRSIISGVVALGAIAVLAGGVVGAVVGERPIGHHETDSADHADVEGGEGE